jgi:glyoxylate/hydroxypyruvate reductase A
MTARSTLLLIVPVQWAGMWETPLKKLAPDLAVKVQDRDAYEPAEIDYVISFRPPPGLLKTFTNLKVAFSFGAGVDGFLADPEYPKAIPLVRFVDPGLSQEMAQYCLLHALIHHRHSRAFDIYQRQSKWKQGLPPRHTKNTRIGILGLGEIGTLVGEQFRALGFPVSGWSRSKKHVDGIESFAGADALKPFLAQSDILICVLPLTPQTRHILNKDTFAMLPKDAFVINVARGGHLKEDDLIAALDSGHLAGAALDVFETEPLPESSPLWLHPKAALTPHIAALSDPVAMAQNAIDGIRRYESGKPLQNVVDLARGY